MVAGNTKLLGSAGLWGNEAPLMCFIGIFVSRIDVPGAIGLLKERAYSITRSSEPTQLEPLAVIDARIARAVISARYSTKR